MAREIIGSAFPAKPSQTARAGISTVRALAEAIEIPDAGFAVSGNAELKSRDI
jgi:hypothetical protein